MKFTKKQKTIGIIVLIVIGVIILSRVDLSQKISVPLALVSDVGQCSGGITTISVSNVNIERVGDRIRVSPLDILQDFDVVSKVTSPKGGVNAQSLIQMFQVVAGSELLSQTFDVERLAEVTFQELGIKNVGSFKRKTKILPDEQVAQGVEAGNFAPIGAVK